MVHRHQLDGRDAELVQVLDRRLGRQRRVGAAQLLRHVRVQLREALDVQLVDQRLVPRRARRPIVAPGERRIDRPRPSGANGALSRSSNDRSSSWSPMRVAEQRVVPAARARPIDLGVRIEHHLVRVEAMPVLRLVRAVDAVAVELARARRRAGSRARPCRSARAAGCVSDSPRASARVEQAQLDPASRARRTGRS